MNFYAVYKARTDYGFLKKLCLIQIIQRRLVVIIMAGFGPG